MAGNWVLIMILSKNMSYDIQRNDKNFGGASVRKNATKNVPQNSKQ